jgi:hypothetical protein
MLNVAGLKMLKHQSLDCIDTPDCSELILTEYLCHLFNGSLVKKLKYYLDCTI